MGTDFPESSVLITGASTGIGAECALHLDRKGVRVFAGVRRESDAESLREKASSLLTPVVIDVTDPETIATARDTVTGSGGQHGIAGLVNNAGVYFGGALEFCSVDGIRKEFEVNLFGAIAVTQVFLPLLRTGKGRIVNMSSISGRIAFPFLGPYAASKFALEAISDSWRVELRPWGIRVAVVEPGHVDTPIWGKGITMLRKVREGLPPEAHALYGPLFGLAEREQRTGIPASRVAEAVEHALFARRPKHRYLVGRDAKFLSLFARLPAGIRDWLIAKQLPKYG